MTNRIKICIFVGKCASDPLRKRGKIEINEKKFMGIVTIILIILFGLLLFQSPILLIISLIKPNFFLFWSKKPDRWKVVGWWIKCVFFCFAVMALCLQYRGTTEHTDYLSPQQNKKTGQWGYVEGKKKVIPFQYDEAGQFFVGASVAKVKKGKKYGLIDRKGQVIIPFEYDDIEDYATISTNLFKVKLNNKYGLVTKEGNEVVTPKYDQISYFGGDRAIVESKGKRGYIDKNGFEIVAPKYDQVFSFDENVIKVMNNGKTFYVDMNGAEYDSPEKYLIEKHLASYIQQINNYHATLIKSRKKASAFKIQGPYFLIDGKNKKIKDMIFLKHSEQKQTITGLKTLIIKYDFLSYSGPYREENTNKRVTINSYGSYLIYFDMLTEKIIGFDRIPGEKLPFHTTSPNDLYINITDILAKVDSHVEALKD